MKKLRLETNRPEMPMRAFNFIICLIVSVAPMAALAVGTQWRQFVIPSTDVKVDIPVSIFTEDAGTPEGGTGRRFFSQATTEQI